MAEILKHDGKPAFVVMPYSEYQAMLEKLEDQEDSEAYREAHSSLIRGEDELIPSEVVERLLTDNPVRVWREYRGMKQKELAEKAGLKPSFLSQIERGSKQGSLETLKNIAKALNVDLDDIT